MISYIARFDNSSDPIERVTVGWLIEQNKRRTKLAWLYDEGEEDGSTGLILPTGCIKEIAPVCAERRHVSITKMVSKCLSKHNQ